MKKRTRTGTSPALSKVNVAEEAGYARTYLPKNKDALGRVFDRIEDLAGPAKAAPNSGDVIAKLRAANRQLRGERDLAIDATRRWMQKCTRMRDDKSDVRAKVRLERELAAARRQIEGLEARLGKPDVADSTVVPFAKRENPDG